MLSPELEPIGAQALSKQTALANSGRKTVRPNSAGRDIARFKVMGFSSCYGQPAQFVKLVQGWPHLLLNDDFLFWFMISVSSIRKNDFFVMICWLRDAPLYSEFG